MKCSHTPGSASGGHRCPCCGRLAMRPMQVQCVDCAPPVVQYQHVSFAGSVEAASAGTCMFCSGEGTFAFVGDGSVRLCGRCVKG